MAEKKKGLRFAAVLNRDGGTLRSTDIDAFCRRIRDTLEAAGHSVTIDVAGSDGIVAALDEAVARRNIDVVLAGGGDGTISAAAARLMDRKKALAVLPAGTMNLFARSLGIPTALDAALNAFAHGRIVQVDMASANGRPFVHQFSIGMHAKMVRLREKMDFGSRLGKVRASLRAAWATVRNPKAFDVTLLVGEAVIKARTTGIGITNNLFGEGHLPYADNPAGGVLGVYLTAARGAGQVLRFFFDMARGRWRESRQLEMHQGETVTLKITLRRRRLHAVIDGELVALQRETVVRIHPGALKVLVPAGDGPARA